MREQVQRLEKLATELLDLSRLDAGHIDLERDVVPLDEVAQTAAAEFAAVALQSGHELEVDAPTARVARHRATSSARCRSRASSLENALVHTPTGTHVRDRRRRRARACAAAVSDDGPGIDGAEAANVFERFYRVDGAQASGSGLGLAIARELVRLMGGVARARALARAERRSSSRCRQLLSPAPETGAARAPKAVFT